ncbi:hypothetical protein HAX54_022189 [Datura stramonium]|uniref:Uncharacterized protein n=1 Tax=Datura stramonium TaxID=4076 RepID=A0ABS8S3V0_DATST|nr:hypothetical protein [Datura stramonium]
MNNWGLFTIPVEPYLLELVWKFYASYRERQQLLKRRGRTEAFRASHRTVQANSVIRLATKTDKEAPAMKRAKYTWNMTLPSSSASTHTSAIMKALQPAKDKLASLCSTHDVLESKVGTLKQEVAALTATPSITQPNPCEPEAVPKAPRSPPDDWWVGYNSESEQVSDEKPHHSRPPPPPMHLVYDVDPSWKPGGVTTTSYHELRTL